MSRWAAALAAIVVVVGCVVVGTVVGSLVGNLLVPADLTWSGASTPGLMLVGAFLGACGGFALGSWTAMRIVRDARTVRDAALDETAAPRRASAERPDPS